MFDNEEFLIYHIFFLSTLGVIAIILAVVRKKKKKIDLEMKKFI